MVYSVEESLQKGKKISAPELARLSEKYFLVKISLYLQ